MSERPNAANGNATMKLSLKAIRFVIEALENYQKDHDRRLADDGLSEDDISDLTNDRLYLDAIKKDFETYRDQLVQDRENVSADV
jgi:hypothetical protein